MKQIIIFLFLVLLQLSANAEISGTTGKCRWIVDTENNIMTIRGEGAMGDYRVDMLPYKTYAGSIEKVIIESGVTNIGNGAFYSFSKLTSVSIPISVNSIGNESFSGCGQLTEVELPTEIKSIGTGAFYGCTKLRTIRIPDEITFIDHATFSDCTNLSSVILPSKLLTIGNSAFQNCSQLKSIVIPEGVTTINYSAFCGCSNLKVISIPSTVTTIGELAFSGCANLEDVYCFCKQFPSCKGNPFKDSYVQYVTLHVPEESKNLFRSWEFGSIVALTEDDYGEKICANPIIEYFNGKLIFKSETEGVTFVSDIACQDIKTSYTSEVSLDMTYSICVYATRPLYTDSEKVYATISWKDGKLVMEGITNTEPEKLKGDVNEDGSVDINDVVSVINVMAGKTE